MSMFFVFFGLMFAANVDLMLGLPKDLIYGYECIENKCVKFQLNEENLKSALSLLVCHMLCGDTIGTLWPKPTGKIEYESDLLHIDRSDISFDTPEYPLYAHLWQVNEKRFNKIIDNKLPNMGIIKKGGSPMKIVIKLTSDDNVFEKMPKLTLSTDESYKLDVTKINGYVLAGIGAKNFFGIRHGLETLSQLMIYNDIQEELQILAKVSLKDKPAFKWRGIMLDTARNFYSVEAIKRTLDTMALVKLNTLHWHITDSQSFPMEVRAQPELYKIGAYSQKKVYSHENIIEIVDYGRARGIRIMPEFDAPAHVGEGWQNKNMTVCFNAKPWECYCAEPPCGQLDPTIDDMYSVLQDIYQDMFDLFDPDVFHMGGDEVSFECWNRTRSIRDWMTGMGWELETSDFMHLWGHFQMKAMQRIDYVAKQKHVPIILWTSKLTESAHIHKYLDKDRNFIQIWSNGFNTKVLNILKGGYQIIISNYNALYFDCGGASWVSDGNNWCTPYIGWQIVYDNRMESIAKDYMSQVLGAEATVWSEQIDEQNLDQRLWPRASALAERLWSNPHGNWRQAETRMLLHRHHLVNNGVAAEAIQPEWCLQNQNDCPAAY
uniref:beta-N-acetylhexosaminidase n=1 Tax=Glossina brevipalpis TaxID=37001 RepID=A0A1A9WKE8_9MUSC